MPIAKTSHPILFSAPMIRAILDGRKTVTRRIVNPQPKPDWKYQGINGLGEFLFYPPDLNPRHEESDWTFKSPYGIANHELWVREKWCLDYENPLRVAGYFADKTSNVKRLGELKADGSPRWRPSIHMPRWACRLKLEVISIRAERLQEITEDDAASEGAEPIPTYGVYPSRHAARVMSYREGFRVLWDSLNSERAPWDSNPWVFRIEFKRKK